MSFVYDNKSDAKCDEFAMNYEKILCRKKALELELQKEMRFERIKESINNTVLNLVSEKQLWQIFGMHNYMPTMHVIYTNRGVNPIGVAKHLFQYITKIRLLAEFTKENCFIVTEENIVLTEC
jgi:hypothetical protein